MSVEKIVQLLREASETSFEKQREAVTLAMAALPGFGDAVHAQMRWNKGMSVEGSTGHFEALQQYFTGVPGLETAYRAVLVHSQETLDGGPYYGSP